LYRDVTLRCLEQREKSRSIDLLKRGHVATQPSAARSWRRPLRPRHAGGELVLG
jgi:hypothetical protein